MTSTARALTRPTLPQPATRVLANRQLRPDTDTGRLSVFGDDRWDLTPGVFEDHVLGVSLTFTFAPPRWRADIKTYFWLLINHPQPPAFRRGRATARLCLRSIPLLAPAVGRLLAWCDARGLDSLAALDDTAQDLLLAHVRDLECSTATKANVLTEVRRLWSFRHLLPERLRLPHPPPWGGDDTRDLLGTSHPGLENRTPRIHPATIAPLLTWSIRFVTDLADDIIAAYRQWAMLSTGTPPTSGVLESTPHDTGQRLSQLLGALAAQGLGIPGNTRRGGHTIHWSHLGRLVGRHHDQVRKHERLLRGSGLAIDDDAYLPCPVAGRLDGAPWRAKPIPFAQAPTLARHLSAACFVVIAYLSGMRPGEVLSLQRDAAEHDEGTGLWLLHGWHWKDVTGPDGAKLVTGAERADPWVVHQVAAQAVAVLERLHDHAWLWPDTLFVAERQRHLNRRVGAARTDKAITRDIRLFTEWINTYCQANARADTIPADPSGPLTPSRFRRTLAWNIVRQPKGLVAAAIQYGHIQVRVTQGYAGSADSGFLDELCFEDWLLRLEQFTEAHQHLADGGHVSGPAADEYRRRVGEVNARFAGRIVHTTRQARNLIADPALQVFPGRAMHCVLNQTTAMCQLRESADHTVTPDIDDCRPRCPNIARTDADIDALRADLRRIDDRLDDPLAPAPRRARDQANAHRLRILIARHEQHQETP
jgi:integrase